MSETKKNLQLINKITVESPINTISIFPSGKIISTSINRTITIYNREFNKLQEIKNAHDEFILNLNIKDELNFVTCSLDLNIKTWYKKEEEYKLNKVISNAHNYQINQVIFCSNYNIISCSQDNSVKIWEFQNNNYQNSTILNNSNFINSILLLEDKKILISSGWEGTKFWNINNYNILFFLSQCCCFYWNAIKRFNEDQIIVGGSRMTNILIISLEKQNIIREIESPFLSWGIYVINNLHLFLLGGNSKNIKIYSNENYECIQTIEDAHNDDIMGFNQLNNNFIISYSKDSTIKLWSF
jgi:WD40 repeat protein